eukprot:COSAG02_NODE_719_length_18061_cov_31.886594_2_plen_38_part_00
MNAYMVKMIDGFKLHHRDRTRQWQSMTMQWLHWQQKS